MNLNLQKESSTFWIVTKGWWYIYSVSMKLKYLLPYTTASIKLLFCRLFPLFLMWAAHINHASLIIRRGTPALLTPMERFQIVWNGLIWWLDHTLWFFCFWRSNANKRHNGTLLMLLFFRIRLAISQMDLCAGVVWFCEKENSHQGTSQLGNVYFA